jgi:hypothetical protein
MKDIGDVRFSSSAGKKGSSGRQQKTVQSATRLTIIATRPKELALMTEYLQPRITVDLTINESRFTIDWGAKPASTIGWGARPASMIGWEAGSIKSQTIG